MRILLTTDVVGGVWRYTVTLVRELTDRGHACAVAILGDPDEGKLAELPEGVETFSSRFSLEWMPGGVAEVEPATEWLVERAGEWRPDVVHLNQFAYAVGDYAAPVIVVAHSDVLSWFAEVRAQSAPADWSTYRDVVREGLRAADVVVAPTAYQSGLLARHYGRSAVRVIHNGIRLRATDTPASPPSERPLVLVAGRAWDEGKGIAVLDRAIDEMGDAAPSVHLVGPLSGPGGEHIEVEHLETHGEVDAATMERFYTNTRLYVAPSLYEPFGLSPLEAAGHGCALLLSGIGSFRELWTGAAGFFDPPTPHVLANRLRSILEEPEPLDEQAKLARQRARQRYTAERMADRYEALYQEITGTAPDAEAPHLEGAGPTP